MSNEFKISLAVEIASGMAFLHANCLVHGILTSSRCMLDSKWTVKISDWEYHKLLITQNYKENPLPSLRKIFQNMDDAAMGIFRDFWTAPEILRSDFEERLTSACDVYSYAIILQELFTRDEPYIELVHDLAPDQILSAIVNNRLRPEPSSETPIAIRQIMEIAWSDTPAARPTFEQIIKMLRRGRTGRKTIMDSMMEAMENYTSHLEEEMEAKETAFIAVKSSLDNLMTEFVPSHLSRAINAGEKVSSKVYSSLGLVMVELINWPVVIATQQVDELLQTLNKFTQQVSQVLPHYNAFSPCSQLTSYQTYVIGFAKETQMLSDRCRNVAHLALDILKIGSTVLEGKEKTKALCLRLSCHVGVVGTGITGTVAPKFVLIGGGIDVTKALLQHSEPQTVKVSRTVFSQLEKNPDFEFSAKEPEWIPCNNTDIESFVLAGRHTENINIPSDTSVDSGVELDQGGVSKLQQGSINKKSKTGSQSSDTASIGSTSSDITKPSTFFTENFTSSNRRRPKSLSSLDIITNNGVALFTKSKKRRDVVKGKTGPFRSHEYPPNLPLSRISENSDLSDVFSDKETETTKLKDKMFLQTTNHPLISNEKQNEKVNHKTTNNTDYLPDIATKMTNFELIENTNNKQRTENSTRGFELKTETRSNSNEDDKQRANPLQDRNSSIVSSLSAQYQNNVENYPIKKSNDEQKSETEKTSKRNSSRKGSNRGHKVHPS